MAKKLDEVDTENKEKVEKTEFSKTEADKSGEERKAAVTASNGGVAAATEEELVNADHKAKAEVNEEADNEKAMKERMENAKAA
jgi:colicin import membrane protein